MKKLRVFLNVVLVVLLMLVAFASLAQAQQPCPNGNCQARYAQPRPNTIYYPYNARVRMWRGPLGLYRLSIR